MKSVKHILVFILAFSLLMPMACPAYADSLSEKEASHSDVTAEALAEINSKENVKAASVSAFVCRLYENILNREPDPSGFQDWSEQLLSGKNTGVGVANGFIYSKELEERRLSNDDYVEMLYRTFLNRKSDSAGKADWVSMLENGVSRNYVYRGFVLSDEFTRLCSSYGILRGELTLAEDRDQNPQTAMFVTRCYRLCLRREPDLSGLNQWCRQLNSRSASAKQVAYGFLFSSEFRNRKLSDREYISVLYSLILDRGPDSPGLEYWASRMQGGSSRLDVLGGFADSPEFQQLCSRYQIDSGGGVNCLEAGGFQLRREICYENGASYEELGDYDVIFGGNIVAFSSLSVGVGKNLPYGMHFTVTPGQIGLYRESDGKKIASYPFNFSISDYVSFRIHVDQRGEASFEITTLGGSLKKDNIPWAAYMGKPFAESDRNTELFGCSLRYLAEGWKKDIWLFGDSYFSLIAEDRWTSYLFANRNHSCMINGYPGRNSRQALSAFRAALDKGTPKLVIWCMGMNDPDSGNQANPEWKAALTEVKQLCADRGIELILATIPSCPSTSNRAKNRQVREEDFRYIDFAAAVEANNSGSWKPGMLEAVNPRIHPTVAGAIALYNRALWDCPELAAP